MREDLRNGAMRRLSMALGVVAIIGATTIGFMTFMAGIGSASADALDGQIIAERWCAACHLVGPEQTRASDGVPTFAEIARREDVTEDGLRAFLASPHPMMPDMALTRSEIRDLVTHIKTLE